MAIVAKIFEHLLITATLVCVSNAICDLESSVLKKAYTDWPFALNCKHLEDVWRSRANVIDSVNPSCSITEGDEEFTPQIIEFKNATERIFNTTLVINDSVCLSSFLRVNIVPFPNVTCQEFYTESEKRGDVIHHEATYADSDFELNCRPPINETGVIPYEAVRQNSQTVWKKNCNPDKGDTYRSNRIIRNEENAYGYPDNFYVGSMQFFDAGKYVCTVIHKNKTLHVASRSVCVKQKITVSDPSMACTGKVRQAYGRTGILECQATIPNGPTLTNEFQVEWKKGQSLHCANTQLNKNEFGTQSRMHSCSAKGNNDSIACVFKDEDKQTTTKRIDIKLELRDLSQNDFGAYTVKISYKGGSSEQDVQLEEDLAPFFARLALIFGLLFIVLFVILILILYYKRNTIEVKLRWIKITNRYKKSGDKAYVSYFYDRENMNANERSMTEKIAETIDKTIHCYDVNRDGETGIPLAEFVPRQIAKCQSSLLVITRQFVECKERQFDAEQAFEKLLKSKMRIIFVATNDGLKALQEYHHEEVWTKIALAVKIFHPFMWNDSVTDDEQNENPTEQEEQKLKQVLRRKCPKIARQLGVMCNLQQQEPIYFNMV